MPAVGSIGASYLAGVLSTLSPCVLPMLPILLISALQQHRLGPLALASGLAVSFTVVGVFLASLGFAIGIDGSSLRIGAAVLMVVFGAVLLSSRLQAVSARVMAPLAGRGNALLERLSPAGRGGQFVLGILLGIVWSPCTGPTLGAAVGLAAQTSTMLQAATVMLLFSAGAASPVLALAYGSRQVALTRRDRLARLARTGKPLMGSVMVAVGLLVVTGIDKVAETALTIAMPFWLVELTTRL